MITKPFFILGLLLILLLADGLKHASAHELLAHKPYSTTDSVYYFAETRASFKGGEPAMSRFIAKQLQYPTLAREQGIEARVIVRFVVGTDGEIQSPKIMNKAHPLLQKEVLRIVSSFPKWTPAIHQGKAVNMYIILPITFRLN